MDVAVVQIVSTSKRGSEDHAYFLPDPVVLNLMITPAFSCLAPGAPVLLRGSQPRYGQKKMCKQTGCLGLRVLVWVWGDTTSTSEPEVEVVSC